MKKVTIIGDIMVEPPFMQQVEKGGNYDFGPSFAPLKPLFAASDYVIGNFGSRNGVGMFLFLMFPFVISVYSFALRLDFLYAATGWLLSCAHSTALSTRI